MSEKRYQTGLTNSEILINATGSVRVVTEMFAKGENTASKLSPGENSNQKEGIKMSESQKNARRFISKQYSKINRLVCARCAIDSPRSWHRIR